MSHENEMSLLACLIMPRRFANTIKPKAIEVIAPQQMRTEMLLSCNQVQHAFPTCYYLIIYPSILSTRYIQSSFSACVSLRLHYVMTDLQAHASCKHKQLATIVNPCMVLWQWMDMFNQYNPLNWDGHSRLLQG